MAAAGIWVTAFYVCFVYWNYARTVTVAAWGLFFTALLILCFIRSFFSNGYVLNGVIFLAYTTSLSMAILPAANLFSAEVGISSVAIPAVIGVAAITFGRIRDRIAKRIKQSAKAE